MPPGGAGGRRKAGKTPRQTTMFTAWATALYKTIFSLQILCLSGLCSLQVLVVMAWACESSGTGPDGASWPLETWKPQDIFMSPVTQCMHMPWPAWRLAGPRPMGGAWNSGRQVWLIFCPLPSSPEPGYADTNA